MSRGALRGPLLWLGGLIVVYLSVPLVAFVFRFVGSPRRGFHVPGLFPSLFVSLESATISLALITLLGVPLAYVLARSPGRLASLIGLVVLLPLALPPLMSGILLIYLVGPYTFLGQLFDGRLTNSLTGIVLAQTFCAAPFLIVAARSAFGAIDPATLDMAATLGHSELSRFRLVALPLAGPGIRAGMVLAWLRAFRRVRGGHHPRLPPVLTAGVHLQPIQRDRPADHLGSYGPGSRRRGRRDRARPHHPTAPQRLAPHSCPQPTLPAAAPPAPVTFDIDYHVGAFHLAVSHRSGGNSLGDPRSFGIGQDRLSCGVWLDSTAEPQVRSGTADGRWSASPSSRVGWATWPRGSPSTPISPCGNTSSLPRAPRPGGPRTGSTICISTACRIATRTRSPVASASGSHWHKPCAGRRNSCSSTSRSRRSTRPFDWELRRELRRLQRDTGLATVLVTHDPEEAAFPG